MHKETLNELRKFTPPERHPSPFATPIVAMVIAGVVGVTALYADYTRGNLLEEIDKDYRVNDFEHIVSSSPIKESIAENNWEYTVVAPTDRAFDKAQWRRDEAGNLAPAYSDISAYDYVTSSAVDPNAVEFGQNIRSTSLSGQDLVFTRVSDGPDGLRVNGHPVVTVREADNGVIYLIDDIIPFPQPEQQYSWAR